MDELLELFIPFVVTLAIGAAVGFLFYRLKVPAGFMVGSFIGVTIFNLLTSYAWVPPDTRLLVQIIAGGFIGCSIERSDLRRLRHLGGPLLFMIGVYLLLMWGLGIILWLFTPLSLPTALMGSVPGGVSDVPIISADMGADVTTVVILQLARFILGIAVLPSLVNALDRLRTRQGHADNPGKPKRGADSADRHISQPKSPWAVVVTLLVAGAGGVLGRWSGIPGIVFLFTISFSLILKLGFNFAYIPRWLRQVAQVFAGCYIGTLITPADILGIPAILPALILVLITYTLNCLITGYGQSRLFGYGRREGMLIESPAGATDMALILDDMGITNTDVIILQVLRAIIVISLFPQIVNLTLLIANAL